MRLVEKPPVIREADDLLRAREQMTPPPKPATLRLAESNHRAVRLQHSKLEAAYGASCHEDIDYDRLHASINTVRLRAMLDNAKLDLEFAQRELDQERRAFSPKYHSVLHGPIAAGRSLMLADVDRHEFMARAFLDIDAHAMSAGVHSPFGKSQKVADAVRNLRLALAQDH